jgi:hypothetical protein
VGNLIVATHPLPKVSLCLLTYKRASVLPRTLDLLLAQSHENFELIINDDCSPDNTEEVCREYERRDSRVRYFKNKKNLRYAGNQNAALCRAGTDYVGIVHDGDVYRPDMVEQWTRALVEYPRAALVFNATSSLDERGNVAMVYRHPYPAIMPGRQLLREMLQQWTSPIFGIVMIRRAFAMAAGPFDPRLPLLGDIDMWMRLLRQHDVAYVNEPLFAAYPRESDHTNTFRNVGVLAELELILALNYRRWQAERDPATPAPWRVAAPLWRTRIERLLLALRARDRHASAELLRHMRRKPSPIAIDGVADSVLDWDTFMDQALVRGDVTNATLTSRTSP